VSWGEEDDDDGRLAHRQKVAELIAEADEEFREERKRTKWGKYANVTSREGMEATLEEERQELAKKHEHLAKMARQQGVEYSVLEPETPSSDSTRVSIGSGKQSWFSEMDEDIDNEWKELAEKEDIDVEERSGKLVSRQALAGIRVGSAGGWTLEVFPGDFLVHRKFGIGRFDKTCLRPKTKLSKEEKEAQAKRRAELLKEKLKTIKGGVTPAQIKEMRSKFGTEEDKDPVSNPQTTVLELSYADAVVHVPVDRAYRLSRYKAGDSIVKPKLSRVRGEAWARAKSKVEENTLQLAQDVLALYSTRETLKRTPFDPLLEDKVKAFDKTFQFEPTPDQEKCFEDVENDMVWRSRPMDRLVCGDVGFGKTEVALRALYRAIVNGKQAALLAPTGVLAAQHFKNCQKRMGEFGVEIILLRGGMTAKSKAGREMREKIASGDVNLIVGTHALLSKDLKFHDLGLLVVDEEQRFGVKQKEKLKLISNGIDVLTLTATPIPRTLQMSLSGIRDTTTIRSPPPMRKPTITFVKDYSESMIQEAIGREIARGGQCYYVVPRIAMLKEAEEVIQRLFPDIRVITAHGRMSKNGAEENVAEFAEGGYEVLLATTVIENGVDIPRVNTIIVQNSQAFGMSTLYQLRGRVGRSDKQGYSYFLHREESITEQASLRLQAIGDLSELGSGFDVANRDLEIRGAGSLLGTEQSGMAAKVGFDLYMRMLKKSIRQLRGLDLPLVPRTNVLLQTDGTPGTFEVPDGFISDFKEKKREESKARLAESTASLVQLSNQWKKSYGSLPTDLQGKLKTMHLHACTRRLGIDLVGVVEDKKTGTKNCVLRSPGLRPRHWETITANLPNEGAPKGLDIVFPHRFTVSGKEETIVGGRKANLKRVIAEETDEREDQAWDAMDQEEVEAMKEISSAVSVKNLADVDLEQYPRLVIRNFVDDEKGVERLLKFLLPVSKVVFEAQQNQAEQARAASQLREKQKQLREKQNIMEKERLNRISINP